MKTDALKRSHIATAILCLAISLCTAATGEEVPTDNPVAGYDLDWTGSLRWARVVSIEDFDSSSIEGRLEEAQQAVASRSGGVVFFPAGTYRFRDSIRIRDGVVIRGARPEVVDARDERYEPPTRFEFPKYDPVLEGDGTPIDTAFKGIYLADPERASRCGIVNVAINRGHIDFAEGPEHRCGRNRVVYGCVLRNAAVADPRVPDVQGGQHPWQRFTQRHRAAVTLKSAENCLIANNRLPQSGEDNFTMPGYLLKGRPFDVVFDYDNRPGLYINDFGLGGAGGNGPDGTPETHPWGFRKGTVIRDNYVYCTGRCAISFSGDSTICADNVIRFADNVWRPTTTGTNLTTGSSTNDNRAVQMRGWRWTVEGNDYRVYRNWAAGRNYRINDGEGLMHEDHVNSTVRNSKVISNRGNTYISIYKTAGIDGLLIRDNDIRTSDGIATIYAVANRNSGPYECRNVTIEGNTTAGSGIRIAGDPASGNVIRNNRHIGPGGRIVNDADARCENNTGYELVTP